MKCPYGIYEDECPNCKKFESCFYHMSSLKENPSKNPIEDIVLYKKESQEDVQ
jgi:hypothetical protein